MSLFQNLEKDRQIESLKRQLAQAQISGGGGGGGGPKSTQNAATVGSEFPGNSSNIRNLLSLKTIIGV